MNARTSNFVDAARWLAAVAVLFTHVAQSVLVPIGEIPPAYRGLLAYFTWFFYGFAHQAVVVFFVMSGFLVGGSVLSQASRGHRFLHGYMIDRTIRIYIVLAPTLFLTLVLDALGRHWFASTGIYDLPIYSARSDAGVFLGNLLNLQDIFIPYFGTNSALWTLAHEYWYYVTFGMIGVSLSSGYSRRVRRASGAAAIALLAIMSFSLSYHFFGFFLWLSGVAAARASRPLVRSSRTAAVLFLVTAIGLRLLVRYSLIEVWWVGGVADLVVAATFANALLAMRFDDRPSGLFCAWRGHKQIAEMSYSLYAIHMPVTVLLCAAAQSRFGFGWRTIPIDATKWLAAGGLLTLVFVSSWVFWRIFEAQTPIVRTLARRVLSRSWGHPDSAGSLRLSADGSASSP